MIRPETTTDQTSSYLISYPQLEQRKGLPTYELIDLCGHYEIILVQPTDLMGPPIEIQIASIPKFLVWRLSANLVVDGNTKTRLHLPVG